jgi:hypothetical protein
MKRFALLFASFALALSIAGCGGSGSAGARVEDMPDEVKEYEARREAERSSGKTPSAKAVSRAPIKGSAAQGEPGGK